MTLRIVSPEEAQRMLSNVRDYTRPGPVADLAHTVATERDRIKDAERRGAVTALRNYARSHLDAHADRYADAIETGAETL